ncbi:hypothetical protein L6452_02767 [Arctium lappa]|uniref:Uncharacterized protein n=1 Tax=Arctium lappa TaxID=4217 RepID=A0ACB9FL87_ARCLA|nr:hypothetical protein L6452_02767 [Arctium lappa]
MELNGNGKEVIYPKLVGKNVLIAPVDGFMNADVHEGGCSADAVVVNHVNVSNVVDKGKKATNMTECFGADMVGEDDSCDGIDESDNISQVMEETLGGSKYYILVVDDSLKIKIALVAGFDVMVRHHLRLISEIHDLDEAMKDARLQKKDLFDKYEKTVDNMMQAFLENQGLKYKLKCVEDACTCGALQRFPYPIQN